jgi:hypothetical protein
MELAILLYIPFCGGFEKSKLNARFIRKKIYLLWYYGTYMAEPGLKSIITAMLASFV